MTNTNGWALKRPLTRMRAACWLVSLLALSACSLSACGGKVVFQTGEPEGGGGAGAGGSDPGPECVLPCGEPCTKCIGSDCFTGHCTDDGFCDPPEVPLSCFDG